MKFSFATALALGLLAPCAVPAATVVTNGTISLGVDDYAQLIVATPDDPSQSGIGFTGLRLTGSNRDSMVDGCLCEGWGAGAADADGNSLGSGWADNAFFGSYSLDPDSFVTDGVSATVKTRVLDHDAQELLFVTHDFAPATETQYLYRIRVTLQNNWGADIPDLRYTRLVDWDIEPTSFQEYVSIGGTASNPAVLFAENDGFGRPDPFAPRNGIDSLFPVLNRVQGDQTDTGPQDQGALFDLALGELLAGQSFAFDMFYGAAPTEQDAQDALAAVGAEVWSSARSGESGGPTYLLAFAGLQRTSEPPTVPVPASGILLLAGLGGLAALRRSHPGRST